MCGFVGKVSRESLGDKDEIQIKKMLDLIYHRGPDDTSFRVKPEFVFGFQRLSIIDLKERSNQPMTDEQTGVCMVFNGEIYNYKEVKSTLQKDGVNFDTTSDSEVALKAYVHRGENFTDLLEGMYAIAIYDPRDHKTVLYRDPLGIKPLYYYKDKNSVFFASEIKSFAPVLDNQPNYTQLSEYCIFGCLSGRETLFCDIMQVLPGEAVTVSESLSISTRIFYDSTESFFLPLDRKLSTKDLAEFTEQIIHSHTNCDVTFGCQLSGGLDSSLITSIATKAETRLKTFSVSVNHKILDERKNQEIVADRFGTKHHRYDLGQNELFASMAEATWAMDYPLFHPNIPPCDRICNSAKQEGVKVLLAGDGADELFGGYGWHLDSNNRFDFSHYEQIDRTVYASSVNNPLLVNRLLNCNPPSLTERKEVASRFEIEGDAKLALDQKFNLQKWLQRQDRMGMRNSIEVRVPFCSVALFEMINPLSFAEKTDRGSEKKAILKKIAKSYLPEEIIWQRKVGFTIPIDQWFRRSPNREWVQDLLTSKRTLDRGIFNPSHVMVLVDDHMKGKADCGYLLWTLLSLEIWFRVHIDRSGSKPT